MAEVAARRGDFAALIRETAIGLSWNAPGASHAWREHDLRTDAPLPSLDDANAFIITGSAASVTERAPWMLRAEDYVRHVVAREIPLLGICFGHQLVAQALGGLVAKNPRGREIGTVRAWQLGLEDDALLEGVPSELEVNMTHVDSVARMPPGARILASTKKEPSAIFAIGERTRCVQFHPEFDADVVRGYIRARASTIAAEGADPEALLASAKDAPNGARVLQNFVARFVGDASVAKKKKRA